MTTYLPSGQGPFLHKRPPFPSSSRCLLSKRLGRRLDSSDDSWLIFWGMVNKAMRLR